MSRFILKPPSPAEQEIKMADRSPLLLAKEDGQALGKDEQIMEFTVRSRYKDANGQEAETKKLPIFRVRASVSQIENGKLSGFWQDVRKSFCPAFDTVKDVEAARKGEDKSALRAIRMTEGICNERTNEYKKHAMTMTPSHYPYKATDMAGSFAFDADLKHAAPITPDHLKVFVHALKNQMGNRDSMGDVSSGEIKYLWSPLEEGFEESSSDIAVYAKNLEEFLGWNGRVVDWEFVEWNPPAKR